MNYFRKQYINKKGINPKDWLHIGHKNFFYYDATNNTSESLNNVLKKKELLPFNLIKTVKKLVSALQYNRDNYENYKKNHCYDYSLQKSFHLKDKRVEKNQEKIQILNESFPNLKKYRTK